MFHPPFHVVIVTLTTVLSIFFNGILLLVVFFRSSPTIGRYRYLIMIFAFFNIIYSVVHGSLQPAIHVYEMTFMELATTGTTSIIFDTILSSFFASCFAQSLLLFALHYFYRYIYTVKPELQWIFHDKQPISFMIFLYCFVAIDYGAVCFFNFGKTNEKDEYWKEEFYSSYGENIADFGYIAGLYWVNGSWQLKDLLGLLNVSLVIGSTLAVLIYCAITVYRTIGKIQSMSGRLKNQQNQLFKTGLSVIFTFIPSSFVLASAFFFGKSVGSRANIVSLLLTIFSVLDPLLLLYFVGCYRSAIRNFICRSTQEMPSGTSVVQQTKIFQPTSMSRITVKR